mgnify:FL=1
MNTLRQKMLDAKRMQLKGLAVRTQEAYVNAVLQLSRHFKKSPDSIDEQELREYFLYLKNKKNRWRKVHSPLRYTGSNSSMNTRWEKNGISCNSLVLTEKRNCHWFSAWRR